MSPLYVWGLTDEVPPRRLQLTKARRAAIRRKKERDRANRAARQETPENMALKCAVGAVRRAYLRDDPSEESIARWWAVALGLRFERSGPFPGEWRAMAQALAAVAEGGCRVTRDSAERITTLAAEMWPLREEG